MHNDKDNKRKLLSEEQVQYFYHPVIQLIFLYIETRPELQHIVAFMTTGVN